MRPYNMLLHSAHLLLQQLLPAHRCHGVWQANIRYRSSDLIAVLNKAWLPAATEPIIQRIDKDLNRLFLRFSDIIVPTPSSGD